MGRVVVDVMPKPEILDPQGKAVARALPRLGLTGFTDVRQGKRFELVVDGDVTPEVLDRARRAAETLLSNPVIEDVVRVAELRGEAAPAAAGPDAIPAALEAAEAAVGASADSVVAGGTASSGSPAGGTGSPGPRASSDTPGADTPATAGTPR